MSFFFRSLLILAVFASIGVEAYRFDECAFGSGPCDVMAHGLAALSFFGAVFLSIGPMLNRFVWHTFEFAQDPQQLERWQERCDRAGYGLIWLSGINYDGSLRK